VIDYQSSKYKLTKYISTIS